jgi:hypothetical protein
MYKTIYSYLWLFTLLILKKQFFNKYQASVMSRDTDFAYVYIPFRQILIKNGI